MGNILKYKGYTAKVEYSAEDGVLYGKIEGINDLVNFESENCKSIEAEFQNAVDDYLEMCKALGMEPDKAYSGTFNVRISPTLHKLVALKAIENGETLNGTVEKALQKYVSDNTSEKLDKIWNAVSESTTKYSGMTSASSNDIYKKLRVTGYGRA